MALNINMPSDITHFQLFIILAKFTNIKFTLAILQNINKNS
jgi:hypothetical protein